MITRTRRARPTTPSPADYLGDTPHQAILPRPCLRTAVEAIADRVRKHEEQLRHLATHDD